MEQFDLVAFALLAVMTLTFAVGLLNSASGRIHPIVAGVPFVGALGVIAALQSRSRLSATPDPLPVILGATFALATVCLAYMHVAAYIGRRHVDTEQDSAQRLSLYPAATMVLLAAVGVWVATGRGVLADLIAACAALAFSVLAVRVSVAAPVLRWVALPTSLLCSLDVALTAFAPPIHGWTRLILLDLLPSIALAVVVVVAAFIVPLRLATRVTMLAALCVAAIAQVWVGLSEEIVFAVVACAAWIVDDVKSGAARAAFEADACTGAPVDGVASK